MFYLVEVLKIRLMLTFSFGQHVKERTHYINKVEHNLHFKEQKQKLPRKLMSIVGQFARLLEDRGGGTAGSWRPSTLLPAGGNLVQL